MTKLNLDIIPTPDGVGLIVQRDGEPDLLVPMPEVRAVEFLMEWWRVLSQLHPAVRNPEPSATLPPEFQRFGAFRHALTMQSNGLVRLILQPVGIAGIGFEFDPHEARNLATELFDAADAAEALHLPY